MRLKLRQQKSIPNNGQAIPVASPAKEGGQTHGKHMCRSQTHIGLQLPTLGHLSSQLAIRELQSRQKLKGTASSNLRRLTDLNELRDSIKSQSPSVRRLHIDLSVERSRVPVTNGRHSRRDASQ